MTEENSLPGNTVSGYLNASKEHQNEMLRHQAWVEKVKKWGNFANDTDASMYPYSMIDMIAFAWDSKTEEEIKNKKLITALRTAFKRACSCCDSDEEVEKHCQKAIDEYENDKL